MAKVVDMNAELLKDCERAWSSSLPFGLMQGPSNAPTLARVTIGASVDDEEDRAATPQPLEDDAAVPESLQSDPELCDKVQKQVEFYFSDENLQKDSFLMKHIQRNKQGYVSLKLVSSFRKIKSLTKDWRVVLESVRRSPLLAVSEDETKLRRTTPVRSPDYSHLGRTVIVTKYCDENAPVEAIERQFSVCGQIKSVRVIRPGDAVPVDAKPSRARYPALGKDLCILVEYVTESGAKRACAELSAANSWRQQMVVELLDDGRSSKKLQNQNATAASKEKEKLKLKPDYGKKSVEAPSGQAKNKDDARRKPVTAETERKKVSKGSEVRYLSPESSHFDSGFSSKSPSTSPKGSPATSKRFFTDSWRSVDRQLFIVLRQPLGPDGTRGFRRSRTNA